MLLKDHLNELDTSGLIRHVQHDPDTAYQFRHVLTQEAAYGSLLKQDRRRLHLLVGLALEREYANHLDEVAPILARHFDEAEDEARALDYYTRAADAAAARFANAEATMHYRRALALAQRGQTPSEPLIDLYLRHGRVLEISGQYAEALATYVEMEMQAQESGDRRMLLAALMARATVHAAPTVLNDAEAGDALAQQALAIAMELDDHAAEAKAWWLRMLAHRFTEHDSAIEFGERSAQIARQYNLREQLAYALNDIFTSYLTSGQVRKALAALEEAGKLWREVDNLNLLADSLTSAGEIAFFTGQMEAGAAKVNEALQLSQRIGNAWGQSYARWMQGELMLEHADYAGAILAFQESQRHGAQAGFAISQISTHGYLGLVYAELGAYDMGEEEARKAIAMALTLKPDWRGMGYAVQALCLSHSGRRDEAYAALAVAVQYASLYDLSIMIDEIVKAELDLASGRYAETERNMLDAIRIIQSYEMAIFEPYTLYYIGLAILKQGRAEEAAAQLAGAVVLMSKLGARRYLWRVQLAQAACASSLGQGDEAMAYHAAASAEIDAIAENLPANLCATFLRRVDAVRRDLGIQ